MDYALLQLNNIVLEKMNHLKKIGLYFDEKWKSHINYIATKANKKIVGYGKSYYVNINIFIKIFSIC